MEMRTHKKPIILKLKGIHEDGFARLSVFRNAFVSKKPQRLGSIVIWFGAIQAQQEI